MKRQLFQLAGVLYVAFALIAAHSALVALKAPISPSAYAKTNLETFEQALFHPERFPRFNPNSYFDITIPVKPENTRTGKAAYQVVVWTGEYCSACTKYKKEEVPALQELGYQVIFKDYFEEKKPPKEVKMLPTIELVYKGKPVKYKVYWKAEDVDEFVDKRLTLKK